MFTKHTALIADDSAQVQRIVARILKQDLNFGHVLIAANGKQALDFFETQHVDWIISDWEMPTMGGHEFVETLRKHPRGREVPFILMTGHADKDTLRTAMASGVNDFIAKPFSPSTLIQKIRRIATAIERRAAARIARGEVTRRKSLFRAAPNIRPNWWTFPIRAACCAPYRYSKAVPFATRPS
ncbi:response regulator [Methylogaea oryzae]|uniref:response regulator n=1 Tax=Methylogaea oryzae TaxID=1295382 RepID=UPI0006D293AC|nr:response regulator [Methylogaea oryzae]